MTKRHFEALADALASIRPNTSAPEYLLWEAAMEAVARVCARSNPRFSSHRFADAARTR